MVILTTMLPILRKLTPAKCILSFLGLGARTGMIYLMLLECGMPASCQIIHMEEPVQITPVGMGAHYWTEIAADPSDPASLIVCGFRFSPQKNKFSGVLYRSENGGHDWHLTLEDQAGDWVSEETCQYGKSGRAYFIAQPHAVNKLVQKLARSESTKSDAHLKVYGGKLHLYPSADHGRTWSIPKEFEFLDATRMAVDRSATGLGGRLYVFGNHGPGIALISSLDEGRTFTRASEKALPPSSAYVYTFPGDVQVLPTGAALATYDTARQRGGRTVHFVEVVASYDGGASLSIPVIVAQHDDITCDRSFPSLAIDSGPKHKRGRSYVLWSDRVSGKCEMLLSFSDDSGQTWTTPNVIHIEGEDIQAQWFRRVSSIAVNDDGTLGIAWSSTPAANIFEYGCWYFSASLDEGRTFLPAVPISRCTERKDAHRRSWGYYLSGVDSGLSRELTLRYMLHATGPSSHVGMAVDQRGRFHPLWTEGQDGGGSLWTSVISVDRQVVRNPVGVSPESNVSQRKDLSESVEVILTNEKYDEANQIITSDLQIRNLGAGMILPPVSLQIDELQSGWGKPELMSPSGHQALPTLIDLSDLIDPTGLAPQHTTSRVKTVSFRITNQRQPESMDLEVLRIHARFFANVRSSEK